MFTKIASWNSPFRLAIGQALLAASDPQVPADLAKATGKDASNLKKAADEMAAAGLLVKRPPLERNRPGRKPDSAYELADGEGPRLKSLLEEAAVPGALRQGQQLIVASIPDSQVVELMGVVAQPTTASQMSWAALVDGEPQECLIAFEGEGAVGLANDLMAALSAAKIRCRRATVARISHGHEFLRDAKRTAQTAARAAKRR